MRIDLPNSNEFKEILCNLTKKTIDYKINGISTDSRNIKKNDLYIAIKGEKFDGNEFTIDALNRGASFAIVHQIQNEKIERQFLNSNPIGLISEIATIWRDRFNIPVIGITGSNGKTSTKELLKHILSAKFDIHATEENFNTSISLPLTLLQITKYHGASIIEMGANQPGDIQKLCNITKPTHGLITNIAPAHLEGFKNIETIASTKGALFKSLKDGISFVNEADKRVSSISFEGKKITYGVSSNCDYPTDIHNENDGTLSLTINTHELKIKSSNLSFAKNIIACCAVARELQVEWDAIEDRIHTFTPPKGRCEVKNNGSYIIIDDSYNANLESTLAALDYLNAFSGRGNKIFILGDMLELGTSSENQHREIAKKCNDININAIMTYGTETKITNKYVKESIYKKHFDNQSQLCEELKNRANKNDKILIKGSRGMKMENIVESLMGI